MAIGSNVVPVIRPDKARRAFAVDVVSSASFAAISALPDVLGPDGPQPGAGYTIIAAHLKSVLCIQPIGIGPDGATGDVMVSAYRQILADANGARSNPQWTIRPLWAATFALCPKLGVKGGPVSEQHRYADTITVTMDRTIATPGVEIVPSTPDDAPAYAKFDGEDSPLFRIDMRLNTNTTHVNALLWSIEK